MRETEGVTAEAALKERLPPLRKDTLDWRDMTAGFLGAQVPGANGSGGAGEDGAGQVAVGGSGSPGSLGAPFYPL